MNRIIFATIIVLILWFLDWYSGKKYTGWWSGKSDFKDTILDWLKGMFLLFIGGVIIYLVTWFVTTIAED